MKNIITVLLLFFLIVSAHSQMNYQCVILDSDDAPLESQLVGIRASIHADSSSGVVAYKETHSTMTDAYGRINIAIGNGTPVSGTYAGVDRDGSHFLEIEVDLTGGTSYVSLATTEIYPSFKSDEIDPVFEASPAGGITPVDIANWNTAGGSSVIELTLANHQSVTIDDNDVVDIREDIVITANYGSFYENGLLISGGSFTGTGTEEIKFKWNSLVSGVEFTDVVIDASYTTFINCSFFNTTLSSSHTKFIDCQLVAYSDETDQGIPVESDHPKSSQKSCLIFLSI